MPGWTESFAHDAVRTRARARAAQWTVGFAIAAGAFVALGPVVVWRLPHAAHLAALAFVGGLCGAALAVVVALTRVHRRVWQIGLSAGALELWDAGGRRRRLPWASVAHIDLADGGVTIVVGRERIVAGPGWPDVDRLARQLVRYAEAHRRPVWVDGVPCADVSLGPLLDALRPVAG